MIKSNISEINTDWCGSDKKNDTDKLRWDLLPLKEIEDVVKVYTVGAKTYGVDNWKNTNVNGYNRYKAALFRHLIEYEKGNEIDKETGCRHLAQVIWNAIAMLYYSKNKDTVGSGFTMDDKGVNTLLNNLDKRIEDKINKCNDLLDNIGTRIPGTTPAMQQVIY